MKKNLVIWIVFIFLLISANIANAAESFDRPVIDDGGNTSGGASISKQAEKKRSDIIRNILLDLFSFGEDSKNPTNSTPESPSTSQPTPTPDIGNNNNLLPTGAYPSITYYPQPDPNNILNNTGLSYPSAIISNVQKCLQNRGIYQAASAQTGVPWQVLAGIHYTEGSCDPNKSLVSGRQLGVDEPDLNGNCSSQYAGVGKPKALPGGGCGFDNLLDTAVYAGNHLKGKISKVPETHEELVYSLAGYNGWGNTNCGRTPYQFCPPLFKGEDHTYVFNKNPDGRHETMYIVYCADRKTCRELGREPPVHQQYGVLTVAGAVSSLAL